MAPLGRVSPSWEAQREAMPRRRIAAGCAAVAVVIACLAVVSSTRGVGQVGLEIFQTNQRSGTNDYILRRQAMHREEQVRPSYPAHVPSHDWHTLETSTLSGTT
jgi:hypothetical protein